MRRKYAPPNLPLIGPKPRFIARLRSLPGDTTLASLFNLVRKIDRAILHRMLQANFDAVLDSRYAIANDLVWSVFIHPLPPMDEAQFASAVEQVYIAAETFGSTFTSGALIYGDGDSDEMHKKLLGELRERTEIRT